MLEVAVGAGSGLGRALAKGLTGAMSGAGGIWGRGAGMAAAPPVPPGLVPGRSSGTQLKRHSPKTRIARCTGRMLSPPGRVHPVLVEIPLPHWQLALGPWLLVLVLALLPLAELGRRGSAPDLLAIGVIGTVIAAFGAARYWHATVELGPLTLYAFGVLVSAALFAGWLLALRQSRQAGLSQNAVSTCYLVTAGGGLVGARVLYVLTNWSDFRKVSEIVAFQNGGLVFYGGVLGGFLASLGYSRARRLSWLAWADVAAPSLALGSSIGRIGCYMAGCDYGVPLGDKAPHWLSRLGTFPRWPEDIAHPAAGSPAWIDHVLYRGLPVDSTASLAVHPTQLYESLAALALLLVLLSIGSRRRFRGEVFLVFVIGYGAIRFFLELLRDDPERGFYGPTMPARFVIGVAAAILGLAFSLGPAATFRAGPSRGLVRAVSFLPAGIVFFTLRHSPALRLSTSQWIALLSSLAAAAAWRKLTGKKGAGPPGSPEALAPAG